MLLNICQHALEKLYESFFIIVAKLANNCGFENVLRKILNRQAQLLRKKFM